jgi:flagellar protein FliS
VYERLFDHLKIGKKELENGRYGIESFTKAHDLIQQGLVACIDYKEGGDIAQSLGAIYEWALREIINARVTKSPEKIQEVLDVLTPLYEAWVSLAPKEPIPVLQAVSSSNPARVAAAY